MSSFIVCCFDDNTIVYLFSKSHLLVDSGTPYELNSLLLIIDHTAHVVCSIISSSSSITTLIDEVVPH